LPFAPQEGAYALIFKSTHYPNQLVATRKGSPLLIGIKAEGQMEDHIAVNYDSKTPVPAATASKFSTTLGNLCWCLSALFLPF